MCDERERLIGYVYGECDAVERRTIDAHVEGCDTCRDEIGALQAVRTDLLAWDVPAHESVWRPFAPARVEPWWRGVPAWALAAAASIMFLCGAAGSATMQAISSPGAGTDRASAGRDGSPQPQLATINPGVTPADLEALERRVVQLMRGEIEGVNQRVRLASGHGAGPAFVSVSNDNALAARVGEIASFQTDMWNLLSDTTNNMAKLTRRANDVENALRAQNGHIQALLAQQPLGQGGAGGGR